MWPPWISFASMRRPERSRLALPHLVDYKNLFRKLEKTLATLERSEDTIETLSAILRRLVDDFREELGVVGGRLYRRRGAHYVLEIQVPGNRKLQGFRIPASYAPIRELLERGYVFHDIRDPGVDQGIERALGVKTFAAIGIGEGRRQIIAFSLKRGTDPERIKYALKTIGHVVNLKLRQMELEDRVAQAREIQLSLLPKAAPRFWDFDLWGASVPAEEVGGDLYDFIGVSERCLGIAVADSSGHGLPAALQARDVIVGLRMGVEERFRITSTIEKLNRVISRSALASKFISLFYGEIEPNGNLVYCNAGHPPPLLWMNGARQELRHGGLVLGPDPDALYERGYVHLSPGAVFLAYTDGITEAENPAGEAFGVDRLIEILRRGLPTARTLVEAVFQSVRTFSGIEAPRDDQTVLAVIRRVGRGEASTRR